MYQAKENVHDIQINEQKGKNVLSKRPATQYSTEVTWATRWGQGQEVSRINHEIHSVQKIEKQL